MLDTGGGVVGHHVIEAATRPPGPLCTRLRQLQRSQVLLAHAAGRNTRRASSGHVRRPLDTRRPQANEASSGQHLQSGQRQRSGQHMLPNAHLPELRVVLVTVAADRSRPCHGTGQWLSGRARRLDTWRTRRCFECSRRPQWCKPRRRHVQSSRQGEAAAAVRPSDATPEASQPGSGGSLRVTVTSST